LTGPHNPPAVWSQLVLATLQESGAAALAAPPTRRGGQRSLEWRGGAGGRVVRAGQPRAAGEGGRPFRPRSFSGFQVLLLIGNHDGGLGLCSCLLKRAETKLGKMAW